jgi:hypothetical protein
MMLRTRPNIQAMAAPPRNVRGTSTGFGQWHAAKIIPVSPAACHSFFMSDSILLCRSELRATCCNTQNAK